MSCHKGSGFRQGLFLFLRAGAFPTGSFSARTKNGFSFALSGRSLEKPKN